MLESDLFSVRVFAPASVSNLGPGFDVLGLALDSPGDVVDAGRRGEAGVEIVAVSGDGGVLSTDPTRNVVGVSAAHVLARARAAGVAAADDGIRLRLTKDMPLASGLGSSAASSVAGAMAANELLGRPFTRLELLASVLEGERAACGSAHADNGAPSLLGGLVLIRSYDPLEVVSLPVPPRLRVAVVHPHHLVPTAAARALVSERAYPIGDIVRNLGNVAALISALYRDDLGLLGRSIDDRLVEPVRAGLIPGFDAVKAAALAAGALGCSISGAGPSVFALTDSDEGAARAAEAMRGAFLAAGLDADTFVGPVNAGGARVLDG